MSSALVALLRSTSAALAAGVPAAGFAAVVFVVAGLAAGLAVCANPGTATSRMTATPTSRDERAFRIFMNDLQSGILQLQPCHTTRLKPCAATLGRGTALGCATRF